jgi:hypothetical protein
MRKACELDLKNTTTGAGVGVSQSAQMTPAILEYQLHNRFSVQQGGTQ